MIFTTVENTVKGKKTYIIAFLLVLVAVVNYIAGDVSLNELLQDQNLLVLLNGLGLAALRAGVSK
jgi:hypothetical protein